MSEMIERVARGLRFMMYGVPHDRPMDKSSPWLTYAMGAIDDMREPTVEMLVAAQEEWMCVRAAEERGDFIWRAMIDAAIARPVGNSLKPGSALSEDRNG